jgi:hypothetical protein
VLSQLPRPHRSAARLFRSLCLKLQIAQRIPRIDAFLEVLEKEFAESAETFVLGYVSQFMDQQPAVSPVIRLNEDAVVQRHPDCLRRNEPKLCSNGPKQAICRRDDVDSQQPDFVRMDNADLPSLVCLSRRQCHPSTQNGGFVPGGPDARNRKKCCDDNSRHVDPWHLKNALEASHGNFSA